MKNIFVAPAVGASMALIVAAVFGLVSDNQSDLGGGTRFPNGISADSTSPVAGEVRGTDLTITDDAAIAGDVAVTGELTMLEGNLATSGPGTLTKSQSGTTFYIGTPSGTTTLPAVATATGTVYTFVITANIATNTVIASAEGDNIEGSMIVAGAVVDCNAADRISFLADGENLGDAVTVRSDGQAWYITSSNALTSAKLTCDG